MGIKIQMGPRRNRSVVAALFGGLISTGLSITSFVVVFSGARVSGGLPFLPSELNQGMGRVFFALGAIFVGGMAVYAFHEAWCLHRERKALDRNGG